MHQGHAPGWMRCGATSPHHHTTTMLERLAVEPEARAGPAALRLNLCRKGRAPAYKDAHLLAAPLRLLSGKAGQEEGPARPLARHRDASSRAERGRRRIGARPPPREVDGEVHSAAERVHLVAEPVEPGGLSRGPHKVALRQGGDGSSSSTAAAASATSPASSSASLSVVRASVRRTEREGVTPTPAETRTTRR